jgi:hypothetical protein
MLINSPNYGVGAGSLVTHKRVQQPYAYPGEVACVASNKRQIVDDSNRCDLLVYQVLFVESCQTAPGLRTVQVEDQDSLREFFKDSLKPDFQRSGLGCITSTYDILHAPPEFADYLDRQEYFVVWIAEKTDCTYIGSGAFAYFTDDIGIDKEQR